jgi:tripartite-type tricarboxylate transporter receptor subunit TctC
MTEDQKNVFRLSESVDDTFSRMFILHPDTPPEIVAAWQEAFVDMVADPQFIKLAGIAGYEIGLTRPEAMAAAVETDLTLLPDEAPKELFIQLAGPGD